MSMYQDFIISRLEDFAKSITDYLQGKYHNQPTRLQEIKLTGETWGQIAWGESCAMWSASEYSGDINGLTVI